MTTVVVSDLHLGGRSNAAVLEREPARGLLRERLAGADRLVLLGDTLELRHGPAREALAAALPALKDLASALPAGGEVVLVPGNHDHSLLAHWLDARALGAEPAPLALDERIDPGEASPAAAAIAQAMGGRHFELRYPGLWLADGVFATHGHYLDCHLEVPTIERLAAGALLRGAGGELPDPAAPRDYEAVLHPIYALAAAAAQHRGAAHGSGPHGTQARLWARVHAPGPGLRARAASRALGLGLAAGIGALNRAGIGRFGLSIDGHSLRRAGLHAMAAVAARLQIGAEHLVFGHTHRGGPYPGDDPHEWSPPGGPRLWNCASWILDDSFVRGTGPASPYWPGTCAVVQEGREPRLERLLADCPAELLSAPGREQDARA